MFDIDSKAARRALAYAAVVLTVCVVFLIRRTLLVFGISTMLAYLLHPLVSVIDRRSPWKSRVPALMIPFLLILGLVFGFSWLIAEPASHEAVQLVASIQSGGLAHWNLLGLPVGEQIVHHSNEILPLISQMGVGRGLGHVAVGVLNLFIVPILSFMLLKDGREVRDAIHEICEIGPSGARFLSDAHVLLIDYMRALLLLSFATLTGFAIALTLLHVRYGILLAFTASILEFVPLVGPLLAAGIVLGVAGFAGSTPAHLLVIASFLFGYRVCQDYVIAPHLMRRGVQLHPLVVLFGIFAGGDIGGVAGILFSVPVLALLRLVFNELRRRRMPHYREMQTRTA